MEGVYQSILLSILVFISGGLITLLFARVIKVIFGKITSRTKTETDDYILKVIIETIKPLGLTVSILLAIRSLNIGKEALGIIFILSKLICIVLIIRLINRILLRLLLRWSVHINDPAVSTMLRSLSPMARALVWSIGIVFYLQNIGVQMAAIWALLSAGGIGAGLALKEPVQEFFEYITILLDKPFQNGQFIHVDDVWATVERVGVRSTRLRSVNGEVIVMSNSALTNGVISNYGEMENRRLVHKLGVEYETNLSKMKKIPSILRDIVENTENAIFDRCHFTQFGSFSLDFELVYYIPTNNYLLAMDSQQRINLEIIRRFEHEGINFAFPTQTLHLSKDKI